MALRWLRNTTLALLTACTTLAQFPPTPTDTTTKNFPNYSISYKRTTICSTQSKAWSGYVHMPASYLNNANKLVPGNETLSLFFWYFEARHNPQDAPVAIYLAGGPGQTSMFGVAWDGGPCYVRPDSNSTEENPWSWNENVNMLYIDQPVGTGFSYDEIVKSTYNLLPVEEEFGIVPFSAYGDEVPEQNATLLYGNFPSQDPAQTANTTEAAARTLWHFAQAWFTDFPEYNTCDKRISIWGNSYGGFWVPASAAYIRKQNEKIKRGEIEGTVLDVNHIGTTNGCIDMAYQVEWYPQMAYNNTYGLEVINETVYEAARENYRKPGGCKAKLERCRDLGELSDPEQLGGNETVNAACLEAQNYCTEIVIGAFAAYSQVEPRSAFDMTQPLPDPFPNPYLSAFFNTDWVQRDLGVPVNLTTINLVSTTNIFSVTGDSFRRTGMKDIEYLLSEDVKVTLIYGDRDYRCPWLGVEKLSLAAEWEGKDGYGGAGYEEIRTGAGEEAVGGVVRQYGGLSFARVFESGHHPASYQPIATFQIFNRSIHDLDIATGTEATTSDYTTSRPQDSYVWKNDIPPSLPVECNLYDIVTTCTVDQVEAYVNGTAEVEGWVVVKPEGGGGPFGSGAAF